MDSKELRNLQEAYNQVYQELDEGKSNRPLGYMHQFARGMKQKRGAKKDEGGKYLNMQRTKKQNKREADFGAHRERQRNERPTAGTWYSEEVDIYDIILSHLLDEGYAETSEAAEAIMVNMSEEWREDIMERENSPYEKASDAALDKRYGYGRASGDKRSFGRAANRSSAAAALRALRRGERSGSGTSTEAGADAVHRGWAKTAKTSSDQTPEKKAKRAKLANTEYKDLPDDEKEKDRVSFNAVKAIYKNRNK